MTIARKGGYQISLGMIVGVVFAIIILTVGINWIISTMKSIKGVSESAIAQAKANLLHSATDRVTVITAKDVIKANDKLEVAVIVANNYATPKQFLIKLEGQDVNKFEVSPSFIVTTGETIGPVQPDTAEDFKFDIKPKDVVVREVDQTGAKSYYFKVKVYVCDGGACQAVDNNLYSQKSFIVEVRNRL